MLTPQLHLIHRGDVHTHLAYETWGKGVPLVCIPAFGDTRAEYQRIAPLLVAAGYQVIVLDLRGMGDSAAAWPRYSLDAMSADVMAVADDAGVRHVTLLGGSTAATIAVHTALTYPDRIVRLALISPIIFFTVRKRPYWHWLSRVPRLLRTPVGQALWTWQLRRLFPTHPAELDAYLANIRHELGRHGRGTDFVAVRRELHFEPVTQRLAEVTIPTMIIVGEQDIVLRPARHGTQHLRVTPPQCEVGLIPRAGHYPHWECPQQTRDLLIPWLQQTQPREGNQPATFAV